MLTGNGRAMIKSWLTTDYEISRTLIDVSGNASAVATNRDNWVNVYKNYNIQLGAGTTPATKNDYCLETPIASGYVVTQKTDSSSEAPSYNKNYVYKGSFLLENNSAAPISVSEVGLYMTINNTAYLLDREVITPITLQPGESYSFNLQIE